MPRERVFIPTKDGICPTFVLTPDNAGPWPAVIFYMDGLGMRPALIEMAACLAASGYIVLLPDFFYRFGAYEPLDPLVVFSGNSRAIIGPMMATIDTQRAADDSEALLAFLANRPDAMDQSVGMVGFCMGGGLALAAAGQFPDHVAAIACFHAGYLVTDTPTSPHHFVSPIKAEIYSAAADNDPHYPPDMAAAFERILSESGIVHRCETYQGTAHGWMMPDFPVHDPAAAARGWREMLGLFARRMALAL